MKHGNFGARLAALVLAAGSLGGSGAFAADSAPAAIGAAVADPARPKEDTDLDAARKPSEILAFAGIKPGDKVVDVFPGGYYDRLFGAVVGSGGKVYMFFPQELATAEHMTLPANGSTPAPGHPNMIALVAPINAFSTPESVDVVWIRQNYHDLHDKFMGPANVPGFNAAVFKALKPGGEYIVIDHSAPDGSGLALTDTAHRIDAAVVKKEVTAAGFVFDGQSQILRNPADPRTALVFDKAIKGKTDQFVYKFRKPG